MFLTKFTTEDTEKTMIGRWMANYLPQDTLQDHEDLDSKGFLWTSQCF